VLAAQAPGGSVPPPNPLGDPLLESPEHVREDAFYKVPLQPEDRKYADIDGLKMKAVVREAAAISERDKARGALFWGRNVGFAGHDVEGIDQLHRLLTEDRVGVSTPLNVIRGTEKVEIHVTPGLH